MKIKFQQDVTLVAFLSQASSVLPMSFEKGEELECVSFFCNKDYFDRSLITVASDVSDSYWAAWVYNSILFSTPEKFDAFLRK